LRSYLVRPFNLLPFWWLACLVLSASAQALTGPKIATPEERVVISIGDLKITAKEVDKFVEGLPPQYRPFYSGAGKKQLADLIVNNKLLAREAERRHLQEREDVQIRINIARESILSEAARSDLEKELNVTEPEAQKYLDDHLAQYEEARVRRIVIRSTSSLNLEPGKQVEKLLSDAEAHSKAEEIRQKLLAGADFEEMAAKFSNDSLSSGKGGDLGFIKRRTQAHIIVPPLEEVIFSIKVGTISDVIQTPLGYEIVKVEERRIPKLADIRKEIDTLARKQKGEELLKEMRQRYAVKVDDAYFTPQPSAAPPAKNR